MTSIIINSNIFSRLAPSTLHKITFFTKIDILLDIKMNIMAKYNLQYGLLLPQFGLVFGHVDLQLECL